MEVKKQLKGKELTFILEGRLDTNTAPELECEMVNLDEIEKVVFDFEKIDYRPTRTSRNSVISSMM